MKFRYMTFVMLILCLIMPLQVSAADTLDQLLAKAKANRAAYEKAKNEKQLTEAERDKAIKDKENVQKQISDIQAELKRISSEIDKLQKSIEKKDKQMKEIMSFVQVSNGETNYLEYIFGATDFTDFIYRVSVAEQLGSYNEQLIKEYNADVKRLDNKQHDLTAKNTELNNKEQELSILEARLNSQIETIKEGMLSKEDEYKTQISLINNLKKLNCKGYETLAACQRRLAPPANSGSGITVPNAYGTYMPLNRGYITSPYGQRTGEFHTGIDFSSGVVDNVYPIADGTVVNIVKPRYPGACGNHQVYVFHNIRGRAYTTSYWHLTGVSVRVGQSVGAGTKIGTIAGRGYVDACAQGGHVHLNLFNGLTTTNAGRINPTIVLPQASSKGYFSHR